MIEPLDKDSFMRSMEVSENIGYYSENAVKRFYDWMYRDQDGVVQVCAFPVPTENQDKSDLGQGKWIHARSFNEFEEFCNTHSGLWRYHVYAGVNTLAETPQHGRGNTDNIDKVSRLSFDIELQRDSYDGSTKEEVWWTYRYALAEIKFMSEEYNAWPLVVMSENGIHLHYKVDFECADEFLIDRQHVYSKFITKQAMNNEYVDQIKQNAPDYITFDQDDVSDPARVMKVPGTLGIKSESGRLCGIIHQPNADASGVISSSDIEYDYHKLKELFEGEQTSTSSSSTPDVEVKNAEVAKRDLDDDTAERVVSLIKNNDTFSSYWIGEVDEYDSRSEYEFAFIIKLLKHGFTKDEVVQVMWASGATKWSEEDTHYRKRTIENAIDYFDGEVVKDSTNGSFSFSDR